MLNKSIYILALITSFVLTLVGTISATTPLITNETYYNGNVFIEAQNWVTIIEISQYENNGVSIVEFSNGRYAYIPNAEKSMLSVALTAYNNSSKVLYFVRADDADNMGVPYPGGPAYTCKTYLIRATNQ